jgi:hypothetical protein
MNTHDKAQAGHQGGSPTPTPSPAKRAYQPPQVIDLGDVRELTRGTTGSKFDGGPGKSKPG